MKVWPTKTEMSKETRPSALDRRRRPARHLQRHQLVHYGRAAALCNGASSQGFIVIEQVACTASAIVAGITIAVLSLWFWFGMQRLARSGKGVTAMKMENEQVPVLKKIDQLLTGHA